MPITSLQYLGLGALGGLVAAHTTAASTPERGCRLCPFVASPPPAAGWREAWRAWLREDDSAPHK